MKTPLYFTPVASALRRPILALALLCGAVASIAPLHAQYEFTSIQERPDRGLAVNVTGFFSELPLSGFAPVRVQIENRDKAPRTFTFSSESTNSYEGGMRLNYETAFTIAPGEKRQLEIMAPLATMADEAYVNTRLRVFLNGMDMANTSGSQESQHRKASTNMAPFMALSKRIATNFQGLMRTELKDKLSIEFVGGTFDPAMAPSDWRAYAGVDGVVISGEELEAMAPGAVAAMLDYVAQGGTLHLLLPLNTAVPLGLLGSPEVEVGGTSPGRQGGTEWRKGLGSIKILRDINPGSTASDLAKVIAKETSTNQPFHVLARVGYDNAWGLQSMVRSLALNVPIILFFMLGFAILVGPVNLFVFAKSKYRYRLFWTTPLISLGTSVLLFIVILLQDGTGGAGARTSTVFLIPGENKVVHIQEQLSRTGLLFGQGFKLPENVFAAQVVSHNKKPGYQEPDHLRAQELNLRVKGGEYSGDWFRSRERQAHLLTAVSPSRSKVNIIPAATRGQAPSVQSNIGVRLKQFYYYEGETRWKAENVDPGDTVQLKSVGKDESDKFLSSTVRSGGKRSKDAFNNRRRADEPYFIAQADRPTPEYMLETLPSVNWKTENLYFVSFLGVDNLYLNRDPRKLPGSNSKLEEPEETPEAAMRRQVEETVIETNPTPTAP